LGWLGPALVLQAGCALILGFEDHEPFPPGAGGAGGSVSSAGQGGEAGEGGGGSSSVRVLLIPDRGTNAIGLYDPVDGHYLSDLIVSPMSGDPFAFDSPNDAVQGPDGRIYVSDQLADNIMVFDTAGSFQGVFADTTDGLDNVRGMDFRDGELFVSVSPTPAGFVARFDMEGNRLVDFVNDGSDPFDVLFLENGTMLMANIVEPDQVRLYDVNGGSSLDLVVVDFPQQVSLLPQGTFAVAGWSELLEVELNGTVLSSMIIDIGRGVYPLDSGQWLLTSDAGVQVVDTTQGTVVQTVRVGTGFTKIEPAVLPSLP
jgi:hypothetical protein